MENILDTEIEEERREKSYLLVGIFRLISVLFLFYTLFPFDFVQLDAEKGNTAEYYGEILGLIIFYLLVYFFFYYHFKQTYLEIFQKIYKKRNKILRAYAALFSIAMLLAMILGLFNDFENFLEAIKSFILNSLVYYFFSLASIIGFTVCTYVDIKLLFKKSI